METKTNNVEILDKLIGINSERVNGFTNILDKLINDNSDLYPIINKLVMNSQRFIRELSSEAIKVDMVHTTSSPIEQDERLVDRMWIILDEVFTDGDRKNISREFERTDSILIKEYRDCLNDESLTKDQIILIKDQIDQMVFLHNLIIEKIKVIDIPRNVITNDEELIFD